MNKMSFVSALVGCVLLASPALADMDAGRKALEAGEPEAAIVHFASDLKLADTAFEAQWLTGRAYVETGDEKKAIKFLEKAVEKNPNHADVQYWWGAANGGLAGKASIFSALGYAKKSKTAFEKAIELEPSHLDAHSGLITFLIAAPGIAGGDKEEGLKLAQSMTKLHKVRGLTEQGSVYASMENTEQALASFDEAHAADAAFLPVLFRRGLLNHQLEKQDAALVDFGKLIEASNGEQEDQKLAEILRGFSQYFYGKIATENSINTDEAIGVMESYLEEAAFSKPEHEGYGRAFLADLHLTKGNIAEAKKYYAEAEKLKKDKGLKKIMKKLKKKLRKV